MKTKSIILLSVALVLLIVVAASAFLLVRGIAQFGQTEKSLERSRRQLENYYAREPFPSSANVKRQEDNVERVEASLASLLEVLREGQVPPGTGTPSQFINRFSRVENRLRDRGKDVLPEGFAFGFDRYEQSGTLPAPADVPRLMQQLTIIERLSEVLFEAGVRAVKAVRREEFEQAEGAAAKAGRQVPGRQFAVMRFGLDFTATEAVLMQVLNRLAADDMNAVVTLVSVDKEASDVVMPTADEPAMAEAASGTFIHKDLRVVSGPQREVPLQVTLEINVYRFIASGEGKEGA